MIKTFSVTKACGCVDILVFGLLICWLSECRYGTNLWIERIMILIWVICVKNITDSKARCQNEV